MYISCVYTLHSYIIYIIYTLLVIVSEHASTGIDAYIVCAPASLSQEPSLLITEFIQEDSPFYLTRAITKTMIGPLLRQGPFLTGDCEGPFVTTSPLFCR